MKMHLIHFFTFLLMASPLTAFSQTPQWNAILSESQKTYDLKFTNPSNEKIFCKNVKIRLAAARKSCSEVQISVDDNWNNLKIDGSSSVADTNYGLELLSKLKSKDYVFCGNPEISFDCQNSR